MNISLINPQDTTGSHKKMLDQIEKGFGKVPNMFLAIGNSPAALESMWASFGALSKGKLGAKLGEKIAVLVADINRCEYCLAAHTVLGQKAGATAGEMAAAQAGEANDTRTQAALNFARRLVKTRGQVDAKDIADVRAVFSEEEMAEILAHVALNTFTNYTNVAFGVPVDFPSVPLR
ncbi:carboxymuconolactone decarboxylase family protein [Bdellovibrio sp. HCB209]|uniref:carboxymuconolactone decarboxylase family protein n=1 Tax=Bdellovibrio sp. HCB209 TaxID=3394354 RepID=UPI0039B42696